MIHLPIFGRRLKSDEQTRPPMYPMQSYVQKSWWNKNFSFSYFLLVLFDGSMFDAKSFIEIPYTNLPQNCSNALSVFNIHTIFCLLSIIIIYYCLEVCSTNAFTILYTIDFHKKKTSQATLILFLCLTLLLQNSKSTRFIEQED